MNVRCTSRQYEHIQKIIAKQPPSKIRDLAEEWITKDVMAVSQRRLSISMPAIGWNYIEQWMFDMAYDHRGFKNRGVSPSMVKALQAIRSSMNIRENHPGLNNVAMIGTVTEFIPAWRLHDTTYSNSLYGVYPVEMADFVVLAPFHTKLSTTEVTKWAEAPELIGSKELLTEQTHLDWV